MAEMTGPRLYSCCNCRNHVALHDDVISKAFQDSLLDDKLLNSFCLLSCGNSILVAATEPRMTRIGGKIDFGKGRNGRAFLFSHAMNISLGPKEDRRLMTGLHTVADVFCSDCQEELGWKYEKAYEETQKYKEGKIILEKSKIVKENW